MPVRMLSKKASRSSPPAAAGFGCSDFLIPSGREAPPAGGGGGGMGAPPAGGGGGGGGNNNGGGNREHMDDRDRGFSRRDDDRM